jgi:hypothetical protein
MLIFGGNIAGNYRETDNLCTQISREFQGPAALRAKHLLVLLRFFTWTNARRCVCSRADSSRDVASVLVTITRQDKVPTFVAAKTCRKQMHAGTPCKFSGNRIISVTHSHSYSSSMSLHDFVTFQADFCRDLAALCLGKLAVGSK